MRINVFLLMATAFLPFPTGILAEALRAPAEAARTAVVLYGVTALVIELLLFASMRHAASSPELQADQPSESHVGANRREPGPWARATIGLYVVAIVLGILELPEVATGVYLVLAARGALLVGGGGLSDGTPG
jgi:uncharacterized membrane protein